MKVSIRLANVPSFLAEMIEGQNEWVMDQDHCCFNPDQSIALVGDVLTYVGQRCPFAQDGSLAIFRQALGNVAPEDAEVVAYESSDSRLKWWETLDQYLRDRASEEEVLNHVAKVAHRATEEEVLAHVGKTANKYWEKPTLENVVQYWPRLKGLAEKAKVSNPARFSAEFGADERQNVRKLLKLVA